MTVLYQGRGFGHLPGCPYVDIQLSHGCTRCQKKAYGIAFILSLLAAWIEWRGSHLSGSLSLLADAVHVLGDGLGYFLGFLMLLYARTKKVEKYFLLILAVLLFVSAANILHDAVGRMLSHPNPIKEGVFWAALFGLLVNALVLWLLARVEASHVGHSHHSHAFENASATVLRANIVHTFGDLVSSLAVVSVGSMLVLWPENNWIGFLDPVIATLIAGLLLWQTWMVLRSID